MKNYEQKNKWQIVALANGKTPFALCLLQFAFCPLLFAFCLLPFALFAQSKTLTLQNALDLATKNYPTIQQSSLQTKQQQALTGTATIFDPFNINTGLGQINSKVFDYNVGVAQGFKLPNAYKAEKNLLQQNVTVAKSYEAVTKNQLIKKLMILAGKVINKSE